MKDMNEETSKVARLVRRQTIGYLATAFGLVAGLAWDEAIKSFINQVFPTVQSGLTAKFAYALIITIVVVLLTRYLLHLLVEIDTYL